MARLGLALPYLTASEGLATFWQLAAAAFPMDQSEGRVVDCGRGSQTVGRVSRKTTMQAATKMSDDDAAPKSSGGCLSSSQIDPRPKGRRGDTGNQSLFLESSVGNVVPTIGHREATAQVPSG